MKQEPITPATQVTLARLAFLPALWWWAVQGHVRWVGIGAFGSFMLDILDGHLARSMRQVTRLGGSLDSIADALLLISSVTWLIMFRREILQPPYSVVAAGSFGLWFVLIAVGILKHRRFLNLHLYSGKANGVLGILFIADALAFRLHPPAFYVAFGVFTVSNLESLLVMLTRSEVDEHIGSIFKKPRPGGDRTVMAHGDHVLLTGATGSLGREVLARLAGGPSPVRVTVLIRGRDDADVRVRLATLERELRCFHPALDRSAAQVLRGDIGQPDLGLAPPVAAALAGTVTHIVHSAARIELGQPWAAAQAINVGGTEAVLRLAERCAGLRCLLHVSTAFVAGRRTGLIREHELECGQGFLNAYERSKFEAERLVRGRMRDLPIVVVRPSIMVGDSRDGHASGVSALFPVLRHVASGRLRAFPGRGMVPFDIVPVDFVADSIVRLLADRAAVGGTFHIAAGAARTIPARELFEMTIRAVGRHPERALCFRDDDGSPPPQTSDGLAERLRCYLDYLSFEKSFETTALGERLGVRAATCPPPSAYLPLVLRATWAGRSGPRRHGAPSTWVVVNPHAGRVKYPLIVDEIRKRLDGALAGISSELPAGTAGGARRVIVVGGDGTVSRVINGCDPRSLVLGVIPRGSANDLAGQLGIPERWGAAWDAVDGGAARDIDLIAVNGSRFATCGGLGLASDVALRANTWKARAGLLGHAARRLGPAVYLLAAVREVLRGQRPIRAVIRSDGDAWRIDLSLAIVSNQPRFGGRFSASPLASNHDGLLDLCCVRAPRNRLRMLWICGQILRGTPHRCREVVQTRAREVTIESDRDLIFFGDGEPLARGHTFRVEVLPRSLAVVASRPARTDGVGAA